MPLPAFARSHAAAAGRRCAAIDRYLPPGAPTAANPQHRRAAAYGTDNGRTDRRILYRCMDPAAQYASEQCQ